MKREEMKLLADRLQERSDNILQQSGTSQHQIDCALAAAALRASAAPEEGMNHRIAYDSATHDRMVAARGSRKAEPVAWANPEFFNQRRSEFEQNGTVVYHQKSGMATLPVYAALAPATEDGGREAVKAEIERWETDTRVSYPDNEVLESLGRILVALSPSPSVGTGTAE